MTHKWATSKA